jgi:hypothetical protein
MSTPEHSPLSEQEQHTLAEHKAHYECQTEPIADPDKYAAPIDLDQYGNIRTYPNLDEFRAAMTRQRAAE